MNNPNIKRIYPGDIELAWCSACKTQTDHLWQPEAKIKLACLKCNPELDARKKEGEK